MIRNLFTRRLPSPPAPMAHATSQWPPVGDTHGLAREADPIDAATLLARRNRTTSTSTAPGPYALRHADTHDGLAAMSPKTAVPPSGNPGRRL